MFILQDNQFDLFSHLFTRGDGESVSVWIFMESFGELWNKSASQEHDDESK